MKRFTLHRIGESEPGAYGVEFADGSVAVNWGGGQGELGPLIGTYLTVGEAVALHIDLEVRWLDQDAGHRLTDHDLARFLWWAAHEMKRVYRTAGFCMARLFCNERGIDPDAAEQDVVHGGWRVGDVV